MESMMEHLGKGLWLTLMLSMPAVLLAAGIGLVVGILQAVTQVQEQTIAAAPKIVGVFLLIILGGGLMMTLLTDYVREAVYIAFNQIPQEDKMVLPPKPKSAGQQRAYSFFQAQLKSPHPERGKPGQMMDQPSIGTDAATRSTGTQVMDSGRFQRPSAGVAEEMSMRR